MNHKAFLKVLERVTNYFNGDFPHYPNIVDGQSRLSKTNKYGVETRDVIGCLLGNEPIPEKWEGYTIYTLINKFPDIIKRLEKNGYWEESPKFIQFLHELCLLHDCNRLEIVYDNKHPLHSSWIAWFWEEYLCQKTI